jgi:DNA-binding transcriptional MerR regulator
MRISMTIGQAAKTTGLSVDSIRFYERSGVLRPTPRMRGGRRIYSPQKVLELTFIARLRATRMPLTTITQYLLFTRQGEATLVERGLLMAGHRDKVAAQIAGLQRTLEILDFKIAHAAEIECTDPARRVLPIQAIPRPPRQGPVRPNLKLVSGASTHD